jgi:hypothetical protein
MAEPFTLHTPNPSGRLGYILYGNNCWAPMKVTLS